MKNKAIYQIAGAVTALVMILGNIIPVQAQTTGPSIYWGAMVDGKVPSSTNLQGVFNSFETRPKKKMSIIHWGQPWVMSDGSWGEFQTAYFTNARNHGSIPMLNWTSWRLGRGASQPDFQLRDIYEGKYVRVAAARRSCGRSDKTQRDPVRFDALARHGGFRAPGDRAARSDTSRGGGTPAANGIEVARLALPQQQRSVK